MRENLTVVCVQQRRRTACASAQSDEPLCYSLSDKYGIDSFHIQNFRIQAGLVLQTGLSLTLSETSKTGFVTSRHNISTYQAPSSGQGNSEYQQIALLVPSADNHTNSLDLDHARQKVGPDLGPNCLTL